MATRPGRSTYFIATVLAAAYLIATAGGPTVRTTAGWIGHLAGEITFGVVAGIVVLHLVSALLLVGTNAVGGRAPYAHVRCAVAWGSFPLVPALVLFAIFNNVAGVDSHDPSFAVGMGAIGTLGVGIACGVWSVVTFYAALAEVAGLSIGRTIAGAAVAWVLSSGGIFVVAVIAAALRRI